MRWLIRNSDLKIMKRRRKQSISACAAAASYHIAVWLRNTRSQHSLKASSHYCNRPSGRRAETYAGCVRPWVTWSIRVKCFNVAGTNERTDTLPLLCAFPFGRGKRTVYCEKILLTKPSKNGRLNENSTWFYLLQLSNCILNCTYSFCLKGLTSYMYFRFLRWRHVYMGQGL